VKIVLATKNKDKIREIKDILKDTVVEFVGLDEFEFLGVVEDGKTFFANAKKKAFETSRHTGLPALADDSGLVVPALDGAPGLYSSRYAGKNATYEDNVGKLLKELTGKTDRKAKFVCVCVLFFPGGRYFTARGEIKGLITEEPIGRAGFGYDPVFFVPGIRKTLSEIPQFEKNKMSHRGIAFRKMAEIIKRMKLSPPQADATLPPQADEDAHHPDKDGEQTKSAVAGVKSE